MFADSAGEVYDFARKVLAPEADGILNWLLTGLADYLANGLGEPEEIKVAAKEHRAQSSTAIQFLEDLESEEILAFDLVDGAMTTGDLYNLFVEWCRRTGGSKVGSRKFIEQIRSAGKGLEYSRRTGRGMWVGVRRCYGASVLGTFMTATGG